MDELTQAALAEKARLQQQFDPRHHEANYLQPASPASPSSSRSNTVPVAGEHPDDASSSFMDRGATPPPYSGPTGPAPKRDPDPPSRGPPRYPGLPALDYRLYSPALFELSADSVAIRSSAPHWSSSTAALVDLIRAQSTVPPKPQIHISGKRARLDFDVKLNLMSLLVPEDPRRRMDYIRCVADGELALRGGVKASTEPSAGEGGLEAWAARFVADGSSVKSFVLERAVANLDTGWLEGQIRSMVAATGYKGNVTVSFPVTHAKVVVQSPDRVNKFFTSMTTLFAGKARYEVVKAVWPFATARAGEPERQFAVQSEERWWREWKDPIKYAISTKRQGWVTNEDKLEGIMEGRAKQVGIIDWGEY